MDFTISASGRTNRCPGKSGAAQVEIAVGREVTCSEPVHVTITVVLANRHIEIAQELKRNPCLFLAAEDHYRRHAAADDALLTQFIRALSSALNELPTPTIA